MADAFFNREYTCPLCKTSFKSLAVRSSSIYVEKKESDFHTVYRGINPLYYSIIVCPFCEYAASSTNFNTELPSKTAEQVALALSQLRSEKSKILCEERDAKTALYAFQLAIRTAQLKKAPAGEIAGLILASAWIAREIGNCELELKFINEALKKYSEAFSAGHNITNMNEIQLIYLIGELNRRIGNYKEAINWFNRVITHKNIKSFPSIEKMAREQWALTREEMHQKSDEITEALTSKTASEENKTVQNPPSPDFNKDENSSVNEVKYKKNRPMMQMPAHLYIDQIEWLRQISNQYTAKNKTFTREETLRVILDTVMEVTGNNLSWQFSSEDELKQKLMELFSNFTNS